MLCKALCAFREPFKDGFVEAIYPGAEVEVPDLLIPSLVSAGHILMPAGWQPPQSELQLAPPMPEAKPAPAKPEVSIAPAEPVKAKPAPKSADNKARSI